MSYSGTSRAIPVEGGFNASYNVEAVPSGRLACSQNVNIHNGGYEPRGGTSKYNTTVITNNPRIMGGYQYMVGSVNNIIGYLARGGSNKDTLAVIDTDGLDTSLHTYANAVTKVPSFVLYNYRLYVSNGYDSIQVYAGATDELSAAITSTSLVRTSNVTTATVTAHGMQTGAYVKITGADPAAFNVDKVQVTRTGANTFTYANAGADDTASTQGSVSHYITIANQTVDIIDPHADWTTNDQPIQLIKHGAGNSERLWAVGTVATPGFIYYSNDNDGSTGPSFLASGSGRIYIDTGDKFGLVGACEYQDRLLVFGKRSTYIIDDSDATPSNWGYQQAGWTGGAASHRLIVVTPNDVFAMMDDGDIYSVTAVQSYGDYKAASIARPAGVDTWIRDNIDLTYISSFHAIYDPNLKAVKWFMVRTGQTQVDTCLVYYLDRTPDRAWTLHNNTTSNINGYNASCSFIYKGADNKDTIYTGDWGGTGKGWIWKTEQASYSDNSTAYEVKLRTPRLSLGNDEDPLAERVNKKFKELRLVDQNFLSATGFLVRFYIDGVLHPMTYAFTEPAHGFLLGTSILDINSLSSDKSEFMEFTIPIGDVGKKIEIEITNNNTTNVYFFIASMLLDYKPLTVRP